MSNIILRLGNKTFFDSDLLFKKVYKQYSDRINIAIEIKVINLVFDANSSLSQKNLQRHIIYDFQMHLVSNKNYY